MKASAYIYDEYRHTHTALSGLHAHTLQRKFLQKFLFYNSISLLYSLTHTHIHTDTRGVESDMRIKYGCVYMKIQPTKSNFIIHSHAASGSWEISHESLSYTHTHTYKHKVHVKPYPPCVQLSSSPPTRTIIATDFVFCCCLVYASEHTRALVYSTMKFVVDVVSYHFDGDTPPRRSSPLRFNLFGEGGVMAQSRTYINARFQYMYVYVCIAYMVHRELGF